MGLPLKTSENLFDLRLTFLYQNAIIWIGNGYIIAIQKPEEGKQMMTIEEMRQRKEELLYTYEMIADLSGLPLSTVQKVLGGATTKPRLRTMQALDLVLKKKSYYYEEDKDTGELVVKEEAEAYTPLSLNGAAKAKKVDCWTGLEATERWPRQGEYTVDDYLAIPDDIRVELIDGVIYDMGAPRRPHQHILGQLFYEFQTCSNEHGNNCEVLFAPYDVRIDGDDKTMVEPDLMVICPGHEYQNEYTASDKGLRYNGAPDLIAEVLSPSTRTKDCTIKLRKYMNAGVREYWIIDIKNRKVIVYCFEDDELPTQYSFDDTIPVGISGGKCSIDFSKVSKRL